MSYKSHDGMGINHASSLCVCMCPRLYTCPIMQLSPAVIVYLSLNAVRLHRSACVCDVSKKDISVSAHVMTVAVQVCVSEMHKKWNQKLTPTCFVSRWL